MDNITDVTFSPLTESQFVKPLRMQYKQNGEAKEWHLLKLHSSVSIIIFNITRNVVVLVRQFRPAVYHANITRRQQTIDTHKHDGSLGVTLEICAGIVDKDKSLEEIAKEEVMEECGYDVLASSLTRVKTFRSGVGISGEKQTIFYVEVTDKMHVGKGGGNAVEGELIDVVEMTIPELKKFLQIEDVNTTGSFLFAMTWFLQNKAPV